MPTPKERAGLLCEMLGVPSTSPRSLLVEQALECAAADAWDEGAHDGKKFDVAENGEWTRRQNPYRKGTR